MSAFDQPSRRNNLGVRFEDADRANNVIDHLYKTVSAARTAMGKKGFGSKETEVKDHIHQIISDLYAAWSSDP